MSLNKELVRRRFSRAAHTYDEWCEPQRHMADRLMGILPGGFSPLSVLEIGCGTGVVTERLMCRYPEADITAVDIAPGMIEECRGKWPPPSRLALLVADAESLTVGGGLDLIISNSCFQWLTDIAGVLRNLGESLDPGGMLVFSAPAAGTLRELLQCYEEAAPGKRAGHELPEADVYFRAVSEAGLTTQVAETETRVFLYGGPEHVVESLRKLGVTRAIAGAGTGLSRSQLRDMLQAYARDFSLPDGQVTCTYTTAYVRAEL